MPYKPGLGQGHNQKKDTHPLDFDVTVAGSPDNTALLYRILCLQFLLCLGFDQGSKLFKKEWVEACSHLAIHPIESIGQR